MSALVAALAVVVALLVVLVVSLLRSHAEILRVLHDAGLGQSEDGAHAAAPARSALAPDRPPSGPSPAAADLHGVTPGGDTVAVGVLGSPTPTLLAFLSSGCLTCREFWEAFGVPGLEVPGGARLVVVTMGAEAESVGALRRLAPPDVLVVMSSEAWEAYAVEGSPYFVFVDGISGLVVGEGTATNWERVRELVAESVDDGALAAGRRRAAARKARAARRHLADRQREERADAALRAVGIEPGDPALYPVTGAPNEPSGTEPAPGGGSGER